MYGKYEKEIMELKKEIDEINEDISYARKMADKYNSEYKKLRDNGGILIHMKRIVNICNMYDRLESELLSKRFSMEVELERRRHGEIADQNKMRLFRWTMLIFYLQYIKTVL